MQAQARRFRSVSGKGGQTLRTASKLQKSAMEACDASQAVEIPQDQRDSRYTNNRYSSFGLSRTNMLHSFSPRLEPHDSGTEKLDYIGPPLMPQTVRSEIASISKNTALILSAAKQHLTSMHMKSFHGIESAVQQMLSPLFIMESFTTASCSMLECLMEESDTPHENLMTGLSIYAAPQLREAYKEFAKNFEFLHSLRHLSESSSFLEDLGLPVLNFFKVVTLFELLVTQDTSVGDARSENVSCQEIMAGMLDIADNGSVQQLKATLETRKIWDIYTFIERAGLIDNVPTIDASNSSVLWFGSCVRPSQAKLTLRKALKVYKYWMFSDFMIWLDCKQSKFKGCLIFTKAMKLREYRHVEEEDNTTWFCVEVTTESKLGQTRKEMSLEYFFETRESRNLFVFLLQQCLNSLEFRIGSDPDYGSIGSIRKKVFDVLFQGRGKQVSQKMEVSLPFNIKHTFQVGDNLEWDNPEESIQLLEQVGSGGFAKVYLARHKQLGAEIAAKLVNHTVSDSYTEDIRREIEILKQCRHQNIVTYYGCAGPDTEGKLWILMDYCAGGSVYDLMKSVDTLQENQISFILSCTLMALVYLHSHDIVHRDIKARNLLLTENGVVKLTDFGVSMNASTLDMTFAGTPYYMSPEVAAKEKEHIGFKADIWALGITAIELAKGKPPLYGLNALQAVMTIVKDPAPSLEGQFSPEFKDFVVKCLCKDTTQRQSPIELLSHPFIMKHLGEENTCLKEFIRPKQVMRHRASTQQNTQSAVEFTTQSVLSQHSISLPSSGIDFYTVVDDDDEIEFACNTSMLLE